MICVAIILLAVLYFSGLIPRFLATFTETGGEYGGSTLARQYSARYFSGVAKDQPIFGLGFLSPKRYENFWIYFGPSGTAYLDDLGIRNMFYHYGVLGIGLVALSLGRMGIPGDATAHLPKLSSQGADAGTDGVFWLSVRVPVSF